MYPFLCIFCYVMNYQIFLSGGIHQRGLAVLVSLVDRCSSRQQELDHLYLIQKVRPFLCLHFCFDSLLSEHL